MLECLSGFDLHLMAVQGCEVRLRSPLVTTDKCCPQHKKKPKSGRTQFNKGQLYKTRLCWFNDNHPDGCPLQSPQCNFSHGKAELRPRPDFRNKH